MYSAGVYDLLIKKHKLNNTKSRRSVYELLKSSPSPLTMNELVEKLSAKMNRTTVYRAIDSFEKAGIIHKVQQGWKYKIELSDSLMHHHHHFSCQHCGDVVEFEEPKQFKNDLQLLEMEHGFNVLNHTLELSGICRTCGTQ